MSDKPEAIRPGSTWVSKETGLSVEVVSVKDGVVFWESERVGFLGTLQTTEGAFRNVMRPECQAGQAELALCGGGKEIQPRYAAYCIENGRTPAEQLAHDEKEYPGGKMAGFLVWSSRRNREAAQAKQ